MATASDIIRRALRILRVIDAQEAMQAADAQDALDTLNAMLAEWHEAKIGLPDYRFASLTAEQDTDVADREAIAYQLALRLAGEYDAAMSQVDMAHALQTFFRMRGRYFQPSSQIPSTYY